MDDILSASEGFEVPLAFLTSLGIGLLLGLQRQRTPSAKAGLRTFALVAVLGTVAGLIADITAEAWVISAGLVLVGVMIIAAYRHDDPLASAPSPARGEEGAETPREGAEADSGTTTVVAVLLCYGLGVMVWYGQSQLAAAIAIVATALLQFKAELHGLTERLSRHDVTSILQFGVLSFIVLPLLPDEGYGPYGALNPYHIWLMVVLVSGISLAGYLALRLLGGRQSMLLVGLSGGLVSSTATTLVFARQARQQPGLADLSGAIIAVSSLMVLVRLMVVCAVVAPAAIGIVLALFGGALLVGVAPLAWRLRAPVGRTGFKVPDLGNPAQLHIAIGFGVLFAIVLLGAAWLSQRIGSEGLYALALASGPIDMDAITLSTLRLFADGRITAQVAATAIGLAYLAATAFKVVIVAVAGDRRLFKSWGAVLAAPAAAVAVGLALLA
jgi:uncharacterized membrane protein (DUF4010 family)